MFKRRKIEIRVPLVVALVAVPLLTGWGCDRSSSTESRERLIVYCSVDETFARGVFETYKQRTGQDVSVVFDTEAGKTTGLVNRIISEDQSGRPRADVFWSSELFNTILLARQGLLIPYDAPAAKDIPDRYRDAQHRWTAMAARARVLAFDPARMLKVKAAMDHRLEAGATLVRRASDGTAQSQHSPGHATQPHHGLDHATQPQRSPDQGSQPQLPPDYWEHLARPEYAANLAMANPLFGTTRGHLAAMFALWGEPRGRAFLTSLRDGGVRIVDGNSSAVRAVMSGRSILAATDTDDVWMAKRSGASLDLIYPDMGDGGTLLIPCSVAIVKGCDRMQQAQRLVDFLVSPDVERMLAQSDSRNIPVRSWLREELGIALPAASSVSYEAVADAMDEAVAAAREILLR